MRPPVSSDDFAPAPRLREPAIETRQEMFAGCDGVGLFARSWHAPGVPRGIVVVVHGFKSHSGFYDWPAQQLVARGFTVYAHDLRGHGRSQGDRYHVDCFDDYIGDLEVFVARARARERAVPLFMLGHSAGGLVACLYALEHQREMAGLISEDCSFELPPPDVALLLLKGVSHLAAHAHLLNLKDEYFSRDTELVWRMKRDPLVVHTAGTAQLLGELIRADRVLKRNFSRFYLPLLILHGTEDHVAKLEGSRQFYDETGSIDRTLKLYEGHYHDLLNDLGKEYVVHDIAEWITSHIPE
jgi:acylglycerol lipase